MGRYFQGDRLGYLGPSNGEHVLHGSAVQFFDERQAFLLGLKMEFVPSLDSPIYTRIFDLRDRHRWWNRAPRYLDVLGLSEVPAGIDARRFVDKDGKTLLTIDNPGRLAGLQLRVRGAVVRIPAETLAIVEVSQLVGTSPGAQCR
jgi:hypothetical protein